ncbi:hypothetical protein B0H19DRAFT_691408 [Mycena capillaripes]|nr:hypothetical protein B0H19DRAFT_691408 [Mycena capillaripes]
MSFQTRHTCLFLFLGPVLPPLDSMPSSTCCAPRPPTPQTPHRVPHLHISYACFRLTTPYKSDNLCAGRRRCLGTLRTQLYARAEGSVAPLFHPSRRSRSLSPLSLAPAPRLPIPPYIQSCPSNLVLRSPSVGAEQNRAVGWGFGWRRRRESGTARSPPLGTAAQERDFASSWRGEQAQSRRRTSHVLGVVSFTTCCIAGKFDDGEREVLVEHGGCAPVPAAKGDVAGARSHRALDIPHAEMSESVILVFGSQAPPGDRRRRRCGCHRCEAHRTSTRTCSEWRRGLHRAGAVLS